MSGLNLCYPTKLQTARRIASRHLPPWTETPNQLPSVVEREKEGNNRQCKVMMMMIMSMLMIMLMIWMIAGSYVFVCDLLLLEKKIGKKGGKIKNCNLRDGDKAEDLKKEISKKIPDLQELMTIEPRALRQAWQARREKPPHARQRHCLQRDATSPAPGLTSTTRDATFSFTHQSLTRGLRVV
ncbi:hypothetical protein F4809DRAFT_591327 [Biscogniauxia mediterranea]|nr:hypothetical protein F4809DRAFT_591327 [Biscogniauxia mediterranea]